MQRDKKTNELIFLNNAETDCYDGDGNASLHTQRNEFSKCYTNRPFRALGNQLILTPVLGYQNLKDAIHANLILTNFQVSVILGSIIIKYGRLSLGCLGFNFDLSICL